MTTRKWQQVEVKDRIVIPFEWRDPTPGGGNLGRAEFHVCLKFKRGKVSEFWVYPVQTRLETCWHYIGESPDFTISAYEGLVSEGAWLSFYCSEHKSTSFSVYSPTGAKFLEISSSGLSFWKNRY